LLGFEARTVRELKFLAERRREFDVLIARGGELEMNREACETPEVDILSHPEYERTDPGMNQVLAKLAAKNNVAIEINFREILTSTGKTRSKILANMQGNVRLVKKYRTPIILCSGATNHFELRDPRCMISMACQLGLELKEAKNAMSDVPERIIKEIEERRGDKWIMPGVVVK
jgi:ribonuclease P/MRP protein subunit RPP1